MVKLEVEKSETDHFIINDDIASDLGVIEGDLLLVQNPINHKTTASDVKIDNDVGKDKIRMDRVSFESIGLDEGFEISIRAYGQGKKKVTEVEFGVRKARNCSADNPLSIIKENEDRFISFISDKIFTKDTEVLWKEKELLISIENTFPEIEKEDVIDFEELDDFSYTWGGSELQSFDGVLLIDLSGSMETRDLEMRDIEWFLDRFDQSFEADSISKFLDELKGRSEIKRSQGAILCGLIYFVQKIGRGVGDKISVIPFSDEATLINFNGKKYFSSAFSNPEKASERIIEDIRYHPRGKTNISSGLEKSIETIKDFKNEKMKMIVLLTDGKPHPPSLDDEENVLEIVEKRLAPRRDLVINTIGLGNEVDHHLMDEIAKRTGGEYTHVNCLEGLTEAYSRYATSISIKGTYFNQN